MPEPGAIGPRRLGLSVVALGGGHGLSQTLRALRRLTDDVTAIVGVADDGGSSGRLRTEFDIVPPGDLRMALAALCGDDRWGNTWSQVLQHRFGGEGELAGHAVGNLLITALWEETGSVVEGLDWVAALLGANGRVLPVATVPLNIVASVKGRDPDHPDQTREVRGQVSVEKGKGNVVDLWVEPPNPQACPEAVAALSNAEVIILGPGSWYTSVLPHLLVPGVRAALAETDATKLLVLNLDAQHGATEDFHPHEYLSNLADRYPEVGIDWVLGDPRYIDDLDQVADACKALGAGLELAAVAAEDPASRVMSPRHDAQLLAAAFGTVFAHGSISAWQ
ncbi:MAG: uridine diphosphate-N-acetylglucosamine-binding protein YvcK [Actinomycetes bacterium]